MAYYELISIIFNLSKFVSILKHFFPFPHVQFIVLFIDAFYFEYYSLWQMF